MSIHMVFRSDSYQVFEYPELDAIELVDNVRATATLIQGSLAAEFRASMRDLAAQEPSSDDVDELIGHYDALMQLPQVLH